MESLDDVFGCWFHHSRFHFLHCSGELLRRSFDRKIAVQYARSCMLIYTEYFQREFDFDEDPLSFEFGFCCNEFPEDHMFGACISEDGRTYIMYINPRGLSDHRDEESENLIKLSRDHMLYKVWSIAVHEMSHVFTDYFFSKVDHDNEFTSVQHLIHDYFWDQNHLMQKLITYPCPSECCGSHDLPCCATRSFRDKQEKARKQREESLGGLNVVDIKIAQTG